MGTSNSKGNGSAHKQDTRKLIHSKQISPASVLFQNPYTARLLFHIAAERLNAGIPQSNKQKKGFRSQQLTSEALDFKPFSALLCRRGLFLFVSKSVGTLK